MRRNHRPNQHQGTTTHLMLAYAEVHYPRSGPSRIRTLEPEIALDAPWRVEPGAPIPVLVVVRDAHWYPVVLDTLSVVVKDAASEDDIATFEYPVHENVAAPWWWRLVELPPLVSGSYGVCPTVTYWSGHKRRTAIADNYRGTSHLPFAVRVGAAAWPVPKGWHAGDVHTHTEFTRDQVEFGPPVPAVAAMSRAMGIRWVALTDHSYDLDDSESDYLVNDPELPRWKAFLRSCDEKHDGVCLIPGEEVSCGNRKGQNVHLIGIGITEYIPGKGDSAERPTRTRPDLSIPDVIRRIRAQGGLAVAAHPGHHPPFAERIIFRRGRWRQADLAEPGLCATQFWNGEKDRGFQRGLDAWVRALLSGKRLVGLAGNDSHGAFGRSRQVRLPWISLTDNQRHLFGRTRTVVEASQATREAILAALADGRCYLSDGPALTMEAAAGSARFPLGRTMRSRAEAVTVRALSTPDWGPLERIGIGVGIIGERAERWTWQAVPGGTYSFGWVQSIEERHRAYVRAVVRTTTGALALTNPIWFNGGG